MIPPRNLIAEASTFAAASQSTEGMVSALHLANARLCLEAAKASCAELEIMVSAREREAARVAAKATTP